MSRAADSLDPSQRRAVDLMLRAPVGVVTGGPGRGKTHCTRVALDELERSGAVVALAASTGKAARRLAEATGREAVTVHRLLGYPLGAYRGGFMYGPGNELGVDVVIVDEASMIDVQLAAALFEAVRPPTRVILVGDADQLPSVGEGRVLADLIASGKCPVARLTHVHRAAAESWVCTQAPVILAGKMPDLAPRPDFRWIECESRQAAVDALVNEAVERASDAQVLIPQTVGPAGTKVINRRLQRLLRGDAIGRTMQVVDEGDEGRFTLAAGDRVIQTRNDYTRGVMNGELGRVVHVDDEGVRVAFDTGPVFFDRPGSRYLRLAYALTVHRLQGSECPWAIVFCHSTHSRMLDRSLLYTAVTRAKQGVVLVGDRVGLERAVRNVSSRRRNTGLAERLRAA